MVDAPELDSFAVAHVYINVDAPELESFTVGNVRVLVMWVDYEAGMYVLWEFLYQTLLDIARETAKGHFWPFQFTN